MCFRTSTWLLKGLGKWKRNHPFYASWVAKQWEKIYFWYLLARRTDFPSPRSNRKRLQQGEELLVGTYAVDTMAYHAHKARVGQTRYRTMMEHWNHHWSLSQGMVSYITKFTCIHQTLRLLAQKHTFLYKSSWQSRTTRVQWPWSHQRHQL
jgi:hypothetical protein